MDFEPALRRITADEVLAVLIETNRQQAQLDCEANASVVLTFDTTIETWRWECNLFDVRHLGRALNAKFGMSLPDERWREVLTPPKERCLRQVCDSIAAHGHIPVVAPLQIFGQSCDPAGMFMLIRWWLRRNGASVDDLRPSSSTADYFRSHPGEILDLAAKVAPSRLPPIVVNDPAGDRATSMCLCGAALMVLGTWCSMCWPLIALIAILIGAFLYFFGYAAGHAAAKAGPRSVQFGNIRTFRDLSYTLLGQTPPIRQMRPPA